MDTNLSEVEIQCLYRMNKGDFLVRDESGEYCSYNGKSNATFIKNGTVKRLMDFGYIRETQFSPNKFLLTDEGRKYLKYK